MQTAAEYAQNIRARIEKLNNERPKEVLRIASDLIAQVELRIQTSGTNFSGGRFIDYTPDYAKKRQNEGYQVGYVDFTVTGALWASMLPRVTKQGETLVEIEVKPSTADNQTKLNGQFRKRGNILLPSQSEIDNTKDANLQRIKKALGI